MSPAGAGSGTVSTAHFPPVHCSASGARSSAELVTEPPVPTATQSCTAGQDRPPSRLSCSGLATDWSDQAFAVPVRGERLPAAVRADGRAVPGGGAGHPDQLSLVLGGHGGPLPAVPVLGQGHAGQPRHPPPCSPWPTGRRCRPARRPLPGSRPAGWSRCGRSSPRPAVAWTSCCTRSRRPRRRWRTCRTRRPPGCRPAPCAEVGVGVDCTAHAVPFQRSASVLVFLPLRVLAIPVAVHCDRPVQDTAVRTPPLKPRLFAAAPGGLAGSWPGPRPPWPGPRGRTAGGPGCSAGPPRCSPGSPRRPGRGGPWPRGRLVTPRRHPPGRAASIAPARTVAVIPPRRAPRVWSAFWPRVLFPALPCIPPLDCPPG